MRNVNLLSTAELNSHVANGVNETKIGNLFESNKYVLNAPERIYDEFLFDEAAIDRFSETSFTCPEMYFYQVPNASLLGKYLLIMSNGIATSVDLRERDHPPQLFGSGYQRADAGNSYSFYGTPRPCVEYKETHFLLASNADHMHHHWLFDVCTKIFIWDQVLNRSCKLAIPVTAKRYQLSLYEELGIPESRITIFDPNQHSKFEELIFTPCTSQSDFIRPEPLEYIRNQLFESFSIKPSKRAPTRKVFINRSDAKGENRSLLNEAEIEDLLLDNGFESVCPGHLSMREQVQLFLEIDVGVIVHGSGGANVLFSNPSSRFVHLHPDATRSFRSHGRVNGIYDNPYNYVLGMSFERRRRAHNNPWIVNGASVMRAIEDISSA